MILLIEFQSEKQDRKSKLIPWSGIFILLGGSLSVGAMIGFVTLFGITLRNSIMMIFHYEHLVKFEEQEWNFGAAISRRQGAIDSYLHDSVTYCACQNPSGTGSDGLHLPRTNEGSPLLLLRTPTASANTERSDTGAYRHHPRRQPKVWAATRPHRSACDLQPRSAQAR